MYVYIYIHIYICIYIYGMCDSKRIMEIDTYIKHVLHTQTMLSALPASAGVSGDDVTTYLQGVVFDAKKSGGEKSWTRVNFSHSDYGSLLPPRKGCRMQRWWPAGSAPRYQVWYPKSAGDVHGSHTFHGEQGFEEAKTWAWTRHNKWLLLNSKAEE